MPSNPICKKHTRSSIKKHSTDAYSVRTAIARGAGDCRTRSLKAQFMYMPPFTCSVVPVM